MTRQLDVFEEAAVREAEAQLEIVKIFARLERPVRERVMTAVLSILAADDRVPGVVEHLIAPRG
jgi:hypothetical protein